MPSNRIIFENKEELLNQAKIQADKVEEEHKQSVLLYFIARYFVSLYEGRFGAIPIQVWNEYRNALDHYFRYLTNKNSTHLKKMESHLQRAALDIMKIYCHEAQNKTIKQKEEYKIEVLQLVDNGTFNSELIQGLSTAEDLFVNAKVDDSILGDNAHTNQEILGKYLDAVFAFDEVYRKIIDKLDDIQSAQLTYNSIHDNAAKGTFKEHMKTHFIFYVLWTLGTGVLLFGWNNGIKEKANEVVSYFSSENNIEKK